MSKKNNRISFMFCAPTAADRKRVVLPKYQAFHKPGARDSSTGLDFIKRCMTYQCPFSYAQNSSSLAVDAKLERKYSEVNIFAEEFPCQCYSHDLMKWTPLFES